ncbi:MAG: serine hydrolase, partial [Candidatus Hydrogenedentota bacterium]
KIWKPLGMEFSASWSIDSEESGFEKMESGINARAIDFAKMGRLFLNNGNWNGRQIISEQWVEESTMRDTAEPRDYYSIPGWWGSFFESGKGYYKYMWWGYSRGESEYDFFASGHLGQFIYVCPQKKLVIVRHGKKRGAIDWWPELFYSAADRM